jgi:hypothetical protein
MRNSLARSREKKIDNGMVHQLYGESIPQKKNMHGQCACVRMSAAGHLLVHPILY